MVAEESDLADNNEDTRIKICVNLCNLWLKYEK